MNGEENSHQHSAFFSNLKNLSVPSLHEHHATHNEPPQEQSSEQDKPKSPPKWAIPVAVTLIVLQLIGLGLWYSAKMRSQAKASLDNTLTKLVVIEKYGYNVKGFYAKMVDQDKKLDSPLSFVIPFIVKDVQAEVAAVDTQVTTQYGKVLDTEKQKLIGQLGKLERAVTSAQSYEYENKNDITAYVQVVRQKITNSAVTIGEVATFQDELQKKEQVMYDSLTELLTKEFAELEREYSIAVNYNYPSRQTIEQYIEYFASNTKAQPHELELVISNLNAVKKYQSTLLAELEQQKREVIFTNIKNTTQEVDALLAFYAQRAGYTTEINLLNQYKNTVSRFNPGSFKDIKSEELQVKAEKELFVLVNTPRQNKMQIEEKEHQERLAQQKKLQAESGIPVPPLDVPKLILIEIGKQRLYAYENGMSIFAEPVPVTTGKAGYDTVTGRYAIYQKATNFRMRSPFPNEWYDNYVDYWMPFYQGYGLHDASWRSVYGTMDYPAVGSHGCVNTPYAYIQKLYAWAEIGTTVLVR